MTNEAKTSLMSICESIATGKVLRESVEIAIDLYAATKAREAAHSDQ